MLELLRLGAAESAAQVLDPFLVHNVSSSKGAEPEGSWSPRTKLDLGRNDPEGEATKEDETCCPCTGQCFALPFFFLLV